MRIAAIALTVLFLPSIALGGTPIVVSDVFQHLPGLPPETRQMTPDEFFAWAMAENAKAEAQCHQRALAYRESNQDTAFARVAHVTETNGSSRTQIGGGYGVGGVGGAGGYLGYPNSSTAASTLGSGYGRRRGNGILGNVTTSGYHQDTRDRYIVYPDLNDGGGGPLLIINPYCAPILSMTPPSLLQGL